VENQQQTGQGSKHVAFVNCCHSSTAMILLQMQTLLALNNYEVRHSSTQEDRYCFLDYSSANALVGKEFFSDTHQRARHFVLEEGVNRMQVLQPRYL
jgi:hypothetical protein